MGRYYSGDIEGKFWFGVQPSNDASFFGGTELDPGFVTYSFSKDEDYEDVLAGIEKCTEALGDNLAKLDAFFAEGGKGYQGYNDEMLAEHLGLPQAKAGEFINAPVHKLLGWYARLELGRKIKASLDDKGQCEFEAEL